VAIPFNQLGFEFFKVLEGSGTNLLRAIVGEIDLSNGNNSLVTFFVPK
jgi:hypothetical protein